MAQMQRPPTPEQQEEDRDTAAQQVRVASHWLQSQDVEQRVAGAEQLAAYPIEETESLLTTALNGDPASEVRAAAAQSLGAVDSLGPASIDALLAALGDIDEDVRWSALATLQAYVLREPPQSTRARRIMRMLGRIGKSKRIPVETRTAIQAFLADQTSEN
jgi:HEAT repeat protein